LKQDRQLLLFLASKSGLYGRAKTSTAKIASGLGMSQQTASRKLRALEKAGLINLNASPKGCTVSLTGQGVECLKQQHLALNRLFQGGAKRALQGKVKDGIGEGKYYVSRPPYLKQFRKLLGFKPFFGTLNLAVSQAELNSFISSQAPAEIEGFKTEERSFGKIRAFPVLFQGKEKAAIIIPERATHPKNEIEIIAVSNLRKKFRLKEGSKAEVRLSS